MIDIVIPYIDKQSKFSELRYALRSIQKNLQGEYRITIIGEPPPWIHRVNIIKKPRLSIGNGSNLNDVITKMDMIVYDQNKTPDFLRWYDDIYLLKPVPVSEFDKHFSLGRFVVTRPHSAQIYRKQLWDTWQALQRNHLPEYNCEVHMPRIFNRDKLKKILYDYIIFCGKRNLLLFQTLYFNTYKPENSLLILRKDDQVKAGFYGKEDPFSFHSEDYDRIKEICTQKIVLNHNDAGFSPAMQKYLEEQFPEKSRYEK